MIQKTVDLYAHFGYPKQEGAVGKLVYQSACELALEELMTNKKRKRPAVLVIPGGGYGFNSEREAEPIAMHFMMRGYAAFTVYYACAPLGFPVALREAAMAMRYIRENAEEFNVDPDMVAAVGFSAGGHLCGTLGTMFDCPEVEDIGEPAVIRPSALGLCYPVLVEWGRTHQGTFNNVSMGDPELRKRLSLEKQVRPDMPPVFLWHTRTDATVPCRNSIIMAEALEEAGVDFVLHIYREGRHGGATVDLCTYSTRDLPTFSRNVKNWLPDMMDFFEDVGFRIVDTP